MAIGEVPDRSDLPFPYGDNRADGLIDFEATALSANCVATLDQDLIPAEVRDALMRMRQSSAASSQSVTAASHASLPRIASM